VIFDVNRLRSYIRPFGAGFQSPLALICPTAWVPNHGGNRRDPSGRDETMFLDPLETVPAEGSEAERLIKKFKAQWGGDYAFEGCVY
jgi:hypothetical protein